MSESNVPDEAVSVDNSDDIDVEIVPDDAETEEESGANETEDDGTDSAS